MRLPNYNPNRSLRVHTSAGKQLRNASNCILTPTRTCHVRSKRMGRKETPFVESLPVVLEVPRGPLCGGTHLAADM
jgi:hypothetical protein